jgi:hypothetical protein
LIDTKINDDYRQRDNFDGKKRNREGLRKMGDPTSAVRVKRTSSGVARKKNCTPAIAVAASTQIYCQQYCASNLESEQETSIIDPTKLLAYESNDSNSQFSKTNVQFANVSMPFQLDISTKMDICKMISKLVNKEMVQTKTIVESLHVEISQLSHKVLKLKQLLQMSPHNQDVTVPTPPNRCFKLTTNSGLLNIDNICCVNAYLQAVASCPILPLSLLNKPTLSLDKFPLFYKYASLISDLASATLDVPLDTSHLYNEFKKVQGDYGGSISDDNENKSMTLCFQGTLRNLTCSIG